MKLILHAGMPKTGSSALQYWMHAHRPQLADKGVIYPSAPVPNHNHHILLGGCGDASLYPRVMRAKEREKNFRIDAEFAAWKDQLRHIAAGSADLAVLSSETLFDLARHRAAASRVGEHLHELFEDVRVVVYVRRPSGFYASSCQQKVKGSHRLRPPGPIHYRASIEGLRQFMGCLVDVHNFDHVQRDHRGIVEHFGALYDRRIQEMAEQETLLRRNVSLSAESIAILQEYRLAQHSDKPDVLTADTRALKQSLADAEPQVPGRQPPALHAEIAAAIDQSSTDLRWLRDHYGIAFDGIDYDRLSERGQLPACNYVSEIFEMNAQRRDRLMFELIHQLAWRAKRSA